MLGMCLQLGIFEKLLYKARKANRRDGRCGFYPLDASLSSNNVSSSAVGIVKLNQVCENMYLLNIICRLATSC